MSTNRFIPRIGMTGMLYFPLGTQDPVPVTVCHVFSDGEHAKVATGGGKAYVVGSCVGAKEPTPEPGPGEYVFQQARIETLLPTDEVPRKMDFGEAIRLLKEGKRVAREGWNGKGMWLSLSGDATRQVPAGSFWSKNNAAFAESQGGQARVLPCITMKTADDAILMGWLASQTDMLAEDWVEVA